MLDRLADELFGEAVGAAEGSGPSAGRSAPAVDPAAMLYDGFAHRLDTDGQEAALRLPVPFASREDIDLKKVGDELIVTVGGEKRTIILPSALADQRPSGAAHEDGILTVRFEHARPARPQPQSV